MGRRRIFVGDVQGCREELERLLEAVRFDPAKDVVEPVGDVVNRGPDSLGTLRVLRSIDAGGVLGNHDVHALRVRAGMRKFGARDTLESLFAADDRDALLDWLAERPFVKAWKDVLLVHAGFDPTWSDPVATLADRDPLELDEATDFATRVRYCTKKGKRPRKDWPPPEKPYRPWYVAWRAAQDREETVVFGHWARAGLTVKNRLRGLDTGCVWGKELTAWIAEEDRLVNVPAARVYSPPSG